jgi:hypothetical protein
MYACARYHRTVSARPRYSAAVSGQVRVRRRLRSPAGRWVPQWCWPYAGYFRRPEPASGNGTRPNSATGSVQNALSIIEGCSERFVSQDDSRYVIVWRNCVSLCQVGVSCVNCLAFQEESGPSGKAIRVGQRSRHQNCGAK